MTSSISAKISKLSPNMTKELIISKHLAKMDEKSLKKFKMALCQMKPPPGAGCIKMENLKDKSIEEIVGFIFRCHTEIHGAATIKKTLKEICENQIRMLIEKDIRNAIKISKNIKNIKTEKNKAFKSKSIEDEQSGKQEHSLSRIIFVPTIIDIQCPEPSAKKIKREQVEDAVIGVPSHKIKREQEEDALIGISSQNIKREKEEDALIRAPNHKMKVEKEDDAVIGVPNHKIKIEQEDDDDVILVPRHKIKIEQEDDDDVILVPRHKIKIEQEDDDDVILVPRHKIKIETEDVVIEVPNHKIKGAQEEDAMIEVSNHKETTSSKDEGHRPVHRPPKQEPQPQVNPEQGNITSNLFHTALKKQFAGAASHASSTKPQPQINPEQGTTKRNIFLKTTNKQLGVAPSHASSKEPQPQINPEPSKTTSNISHRAPSNQSGVAPSNASSKTSKAMKGMQVRSSMGSKAATTNDYSVSSSGIPAKKMIRRDGDVPKQSHNTGQNVNKQTRPIQKQASQGISQLIQQSVNKKEGPRPAQKQPKPEPQPQVNPEQGNITKNLFGTTSNKQLGVSPSHISSNEPSQSKQPLPNISMEKKISNILAKHLKKLKGDGIKQFKHFLCFSEPPKKEDKILPSDVKDKSVEDMVDLIIHRHTVEYVEKTIKTFLLFMKENTIKTLIEKDFRQLF
ncbi:uncharacterized protein [Aquarana catesbeiana]|uniref:uncharacterized protein isoform X2 n=1 Tax=Aquarana catesbeiana TaxID=8400 RepID=UPI003CC9D219